MNTSFQEGALLRSAAGCQRAFTFRSKHDKLLRKKAAAALAERMLNFAEAPALFKALYPVSDLL